MKMQETKQKANAAALLPIAVFLVLYLGNGIYFEYIHPTEGQMGFYVMSVVVAFGAALIVAFVQNRHLTFDEKIHICAQGIGDDNITIMLFIFLMAGAFSGLAGAAGGASSTANLLLSIIPGHFAIPGLFLIACLISMAMGTSVGTITVLVPIAAAVAADGGFSLPLCAGTVVGGAMFGDNLSFISDTTIAATKTQGVEMRDKFRVNFRIALPAALLTLLILVIYAIRSGGASMGTYEYQIALALPYFVVLLLALLGLNVETEVRKDEEAVGAAVLSVKQIIIDVAEQLRICAERSVHQPVQNLADLIITLVDRQGIIAAVLFIICDLVRRKTENEFIFQPRRLDDFHICSVHGPDDGAARHLHFCGDPDLFLCIRGDGERHRRYVRDHDRDDPRGLHQRPYEGGRRF